MYILSTVMTTSPRDRSEFVFSAMQNQNFTLVLGDVMDLP